VDGFSREARVRFENLLGGLAGRELFEDKLDRDARARDDGLTHHHGGVGLNQIRVHSAPDYNPQPAGRLKLLTQPRGTAALCLGAYSGGPGRSVYSARFVC
jgi:hypothetical protein